MILEPKYKNFTGPLQIKETVKKRFNIRRRMSIPRAFECYYFNIILNWWHSPFKMPNAQKIPKWDKSPTPSIPLLVHFRYLQ
jgi:hypothetical protein